MIQPRLSRKLSFRYQLLVLAVAIIVVAPGCRNRGWCQQGCQPGLFGGLRPGTYGATIPAPGTYSLNTPNGQSPYYNAATATAQQPAYLVNPNATAPTPVNGSPSLAPQGWRPAGDNNLSATGNPSSGTILASSRTAQPQSVLNQQPTTLQIASAPTANSYKDSINYSTTSVDERQDDTRLPATDASGVRAPTIVNQIPATRLASVTYPIPQAAAYNANAQPLAGYGQPALINGTVQYGQPLQTYNGYVYSAVPQQTSSPSAVLAQATTTYDPQNNPNYQAGWREREFK
ncbi:MAG: hypothetical protein AAF456_16980 [Planctomycetota bacterium]